MANKLVHTTKRWAKARAPLLCTATVLLLTVALYVFVFIVPKNLSFSFASAKSCTTFPTLLPNVPRKVTSGDYELSVQGGWKVGTVWLVGTKLCAQPTKEPTSGGMIVGFAPFGGWLFRQMLQINVPPEPTARSTGLDQPIPTTKPLTVLLSSPDYVYTYTLAVGTKTASCKPAGSVVAVECDTASLELEQGHTYAMELRRSFGSEPPKSVLKKAINTLTATTIADGSVKQGEVIYGRPTEFTFTADKNVKKAKVAIKTGDTAVEVATTTEENRIIATVPKELDRDKDYTLVIDGVEAEDGSTLVDPYTITFHMSGGPKVVAVSVGHSGVSQNATITITFDQPLSPSQDITPFASSSGVSSRLTKGTNSITFALQGTPLCAEFTLSVNKGVESGAGVPASNGWSYASRITCHTVSTYGYSVKGRALLAYNFGTSGPLTMYVGAIHGNESSSSGILKSWIDDLEANPSLYGGKRIVVVPSINPDGLAANTRTNSRGVNLNRNFPTDGWTKDINDTDGYHAGGGGSEPLSEPEAKALAALTTSLRPRLLLSYHAVGSLVTGDPGGYSAGYAAKYASMVGYRDATGQSGTFDYDISGAYEDWTYSKQGIPSMVLELGSYTYYDFRHHQAAMRAMLN